MSTLLFSFTKPPIKKTTTSKIEVESTIDGAYIYEKNFNQFTYYIETIGVVKIDKVTLRNRELTARYSYQQGNEIRNVASTLVLDNDGIYKGHCTTKVGNKTLFSVNTWLIFSNDGTAIGNWSWSGKPTKTDPRVTISFK